MKGKISKRMREILNDKQGRREVMSFVLSREEERVITLSTGKQYTLVSTAK